jgi:hypothetical protein
VKKKGTNPSGLWAASYGEIGATLKALQDQGIRVDHLARLRADPEYAKRVAQFMLRSDLEGSINQKLARAIMGKNFFGTQEWSVLYGVRFTKDQLLKVTKFPWSSGILNAPCPFVKGKSIRETHFAFLGLDTIEGRPFNIVRWHEIHSRPGRLHLLTLCSSDDQIYAVYKTCYFRWYLMLLEVIPNSTNRTFRAQLEILPIEYEVPSTIEEVSKNILYHSKNNICLNPATYGRCTDITSGGSRTMVGCFDTFGPNIGCSGDTDIRYDAGLAASRKTILNLEI